LRLETFRTDNQQNKVYRSDLYPLLIMQKRLFLLCLILSSFAINDLSAQRFTRSKRYTSVGVSVNAMNYFGDITPSESFTSTDLQFTRYNIGVHLTRRYTPRFSGRFSFNYGRIKADDYESQSPTDNNARFRYIRNASFRTSIYELSAVGIIDLIENRQSYLRRPEFVPYVFGGVAGFYYNPKSQAPAEFGGPNTWVALQPLRTEGKSYSLFQIAIPVGVGFRYKAGPRWDISFEIGYRYLFTDYLDDVSGNYPDPAAYGNNQLARAMSNRTYEERSASGNDRQRDVVVLQRLGYNYEDVDSPGGVFKSVEGYTPGEKRGSPNEKDWYVVTGFHLNYLLIRGVRCPKFR